MFQVGLDGKGFEPSVDALFGPSGFFPDTVLKTMYYAADRMPEEVRKVMMNLLPALRNDRKKRQV